MIEERQIPTTLEKKRIVFFTFVFIFLFSIIAIGLFNRKIQNPYPLKVKVNEQEFQIKIADSESERAQGLMNVESLPINEGMLFIYPKEGYRTFWMKDTLIPLDMIFINNDKRIVKILHNIPPCIKHNCDTYRCEKPAQYVLEINGTLSREHGFKIGDKVEFYF